MWKPPRLRSKRTPASANQESRSTFKLETEALGQFSTLKYRYQSTKCELLYVCFFPEAPPGRRRAMRRSDALHNRSRRISHAYICRLLWEARNRRYQTYRAILDAFHKRVHDVLLVIEDRQAKQSRFRSTLRLHLKQQTLSTARVNLTCTCDSRSRVRTAASPHRR